MNALRGLFALQLHVRSRHLAIGGLAAALALLGGAHPSQATTQPRIDVASAPRAMMSSAPQACSMFGVHSENGTDSQIMWLDVNTGNTAPLGIAHLNHDLQALDRHPTTGDLYTIAGGDGNQDGRLYRVNRSTGVLEEIGSTGATGSSDIVSLAFHPDGTLWAFRNGYGLYTVDLSTADLTPQWDVTSFDSTASWQGLAWDPSGTYAYGVSGTDLMRWDPIDSSAAQVCSAGLLPSGTRGLDFRSDGVLVGSRPDGSGRLELFEVDLDGCSTTPTDYLTTFNQPTALSFEPCGSPGTIGDRVWSDYDSDGVQDGDEPGLSDITVELYAGLCSNGGALLQTIVNPLDGEYTFGGLAPGSYCVSIVDLSVLPGYKPTTENEPSTVVLDPGQTILNVDFGYNPPAPPNTACDLYPIALHESNVYGVDVGDTLVDIYNGVQPGNFGWLTWDGSPSETTLRESLQPPGDSDGYINPYDSTDNDINIGDWVEGSPGVDNSIGVRDALDLLKTMNITVPVWDQAELQGNNANYRISTFARVRIQSYRLPNEDRITAEFLGYLTPDMCPGYSLPTPTPAPDLVCSDYPLGPATEFDSFVSRDAIASGPGTEGRLAVGRDAVLSTFDIGGQLSNSGGTRDDLIVGRDLTYEDGTVSKGNVVHGGSASLTNVSVLDGNVRQDTVIDFTSADDWLRSASAVWALQRVNGSVSIEYSGSDADLTLTGNDDQLNVFSLDGRTLASARSLKIDVPGGATALVNVDDTIIDVQDLTFTINGATRKQVMLNFHSANAVNLVNTLFQGTLMAPYATVDLSGGATVSGQLAAREVTGALDTDHRLFSGCLPAPPYEAPPTPTPTATVVETETPAPTPSPVGTSTTACPVSWPSALGSYGVFAGGKVEVDGATLHEGSSGLGQGYMGSQAGVLIDGALEAAEVVAAGDISVSGTTSAQLTANDTTIDDLLVGMPEFAGFELDTAKDQSLSGTIDLSVGSYRDVSLDGNSTLRLAPGIYAMRQLEVSGDLTIEVTGSTDPVHLYIRDAFVVDGNASLNATGLYSSGDRLNIYVGARDADDGTGPTHGTPYTGSRYSVRFGGAATLYGTLYGPGANVYSFDALRVESGALVAKNIFTDQPLLVQRNVPDGFDACLAPDLPSPTPTEGTTTATPTGPTPYPTYTPYPTHTPYPTQVPYDCPPVDSGTYGSLPVGEGGGGIRGFLGDMLGGVASWLGLGDDGTEVAEAENGSAGALRAPASAGLEGALPDGQQVQAALENAQPLSPDGDALLGYCFELTGMSVSGGQSTWTYSVGPCAGQTPSRDLTSWVLALCQGEHTVVSAGPGEYSVGTNFQSGLYGIEFEQNVSNDGPAETFHFTLDKEYAQGGAQDFAVVGSNAMYGEVQGPLCIPPGTDTPVPTDTATPIPTDTEAPTPEGTDTPVPDATNTPTPTDTRTPTSTRTPSPTPPYTPRPTYTRLPTLTPLPTCEPTNTPAPTSTPTPTYGPSVTPTPTPIGGLCTQVSLDNLRFRRDATDKIRANFTNGSTEDVIVERVVFHWPTLQDPWGNESRIDWFRLDGSPIWYGNGFDHPQDVTLATEGTEASVDPADTVLFEADLDYVPLPLTDHVGIGDFRLEFYARVPSTGDSCHAEVFVPPTATPTPTPPICAAEPLGVATGYNGFFLQDVTANSSSIGGRLAVGWDADISSFSLGDELSNSSGARDDLVVGDNLVLDSGTVHNGNVVYGDSGSVTSVSISNGTAYQDPDVDAIFTPSGDYLRNLTDSFAAYGVNGTDSLSSSTLTLTGTHDELNVFDVSAADLANASSLELDIPTGATALINVDGTSAEMVSMGFTMNGTLDTRVLYNFPQATSLTLDSVGIPGSILAPRAAVTVTSGEVEGQLIALSSSGPLNLENELFTGCLNAPERPKTATPTPTSTNTLTPTPTPTASHTPTITPTPTSTSTSTPTPTSTKTLTPTPTATPGGGEAVLDAFDCSQLAAYCNLNGWVDDLETYVDDPAPNVDFAWQALSPNTSGNPSLETAVNVPTWFWIDDGYEDTEVTEGSGTYLHWRPLGPVAWCFGDGDEPAFSRDESFAFEVSGWDEYEGVDPNDPALGLPLPRFEFSSLGQPHRLPYGPNSGESAFKVTTVSTWHLTGTIEQLPGVQIDEPVPVCDDQFVWVRQLQSILSPGLPAWAEDQ